MKVNKLVRWNTIKLPKLPRKLRLRIRIRRRKARAELSKNLEPKPKSWLRLPLLMRIDPFGNLLALKRFLISMIGMATYPRFNITNKMQVENEEILDQIPNTNVLFIANHQTYYADVMAMYHVFAQVNWRIRIKNNPFYMLFPRVNVFYVAAEETMKQSGFIPRLLSYTGAITVKRSWRSKGEEVKRAADIKAPEKIRKALDYGWVVNFPQGTTTPYAPIRKGTASMIKNFKPVVVPIVIDGFSEAFDKKGLKIMKKDTVLKIRFKEPIIFDEEWTTEMIQTKITELIEQVSPQAEKTEG